MPATKTVEGVVPPAPSKRMGSFVGCCGWRGACDAATSLQIVGAQPERELQNLWGRVERGPGKMWARRPLGVLGSHLWLFEAVGQAASRPDLPRRLAPCLEWEAPRQLPCRPAPCGACPHLLSQHQCILQSAFTSGSLTVSLCSAPQHTTALC